jgi:hypothetical protein
MSTQAQSVGPVTIGEKPPHIVLRASLTHVAYHYVLAAVGSGRGDIDDTLPVELAGPAYDLYLLRRPTTPTRNQWMEWEQTLTEDGWLTRLLDEINAYGERVVQSISDTREWFARERWPFWHGELSKVLALFDAPEHRAAIEAALPTLERLQLSKFADHTDVHLLPRRSFRIPVAFDRPLAIDLRLGVPTRAKALELLFHQLFHELSTTSYYGGTGNLLHTLDNALKKYSAHEASLDVWHTVAHFGAADLAHQVLGLEFAGFPGDRDTSNTRRIFLEHDALRAWRDYVAELIDAVQFSEQIAKTAVRTGL